jgi:hypothetical protein
MAGAPPEAHLGLGLRVAGELGVLEAPQTTKTGDGGGSAGSGSRNCLCRQKDGGEAEKKSVSPTSRSIMKPHLLIQIGQLSDM